MTEPQSLSTELRDFIKREDWTFAETMPVWPHEYLVRDQVDNQLFEGLVRHIRQYGRAGQFYDRTIVYFSAGGLLYWTMGAPLSETVIINRCREEDSYEARLKRGDLPKLERHQ